MSQSLTRPYTPNPVLKAIYRRFFDKIAVDQSWIDAVRGHAAHGTVVYVLRSLSFVDFLALDHVTKRYGLPQVRFANDLGLWLLNPLGKGWLNALFPRSDVIPADELKDALSCKGGSAVLFLKRPPNVLDVASGATGGRGMREGEELIEALIQLQRGSDRPILLVPQVFVWTRHPDTRGTQPLDRVLGPREWPSAPRVVAQYLSNYKSVTLRAGEPINLKQFIADGAPASDASLINKLTYTMLRRLERERRSVTGPAAKAPERVRQEILRSRRFRSVVNKLGRTPEERTALLRTADEALCKMQALPDGTTASLMDVLLEKIFNRIYHGIEVDQKGMRRVRELSKESTLVLLPSHKSHIDYLVVSYVFYQAALPLPLIVAGDNLSFFPVGGIFRRAGAFFIRRSFRGDRLYGALVDAYVRRLIKDGHSIELFLEGMRSRTGKLLSPKFGLLNMVVSAALGQDTRPVHFVPISIGYERIVETAAFHHEISGGEKHQEDAAGLLSATQFLRHRYGRINLQFGNCLSLNELAQEIGVDSASALSPKQSRSLVTRLGNRTMDELNRVTAVTPGALTALAMLSHHHRGIAHEKLVANCERLFRTLVDLGVRWTPALATNSGVLKREAIRESVQMFADADMVDVHSASQLTPRREQKKRPKAGAGAVYTLVEAKRVELDTSKNIIVHFFVERALLATGMLAASEAPLTRELLAERVRFLSRLFKFEFRFRAGIAFEAIFDEVLDALVAAGDIELASDSTVRPGQGHDGWSGHKWLLAYAAQIRNFLESYRMFARCLIALLDGDIQEKELVKTALANGNKMYLAGETERREAISKPVLENALLAFQDTGIIRSRGGQIQLSPDYNSEERVRAVEADIAVYLEREGRI